jgi:hypothetical protein
LELKSLLSALANGNDELDTRETIFGRGVNEEDRSAKIASGYLGMDVAQTHQLNTGTIG